MSTNTKKTPESETTRPSQDEVAERLRAHRAAQRGKVRQIAGRRPAGHVTTDTAPSGDDERGAA